MRKVTVLLFFVIALTLFIMGLPAHENQIVYAQEPETETPTATATIEVKPLTPADLITAVNTLRANNGLNTLSVHSALMQIAQTEANGIASGAPGHWRPTGLTLGQWLLSLGYPLSGDLSLDGYRSENWFYVSDTATIEEIITAWQGDAEHRETMFSEFRSDIGAGIATGPDGVVAVLETALQTNSGRMQSNASDMLTGIVQTKSAYSAMATIAATNGILPDYSVPIAVSTARPDGDVVHEVKYGQTLWSIADLYHVHVDEIKRLNGLVDDNIIPGWKLLVQKKATQPPPVTDTAISTVNSLPTDYPTSAPYYTMTPSSTATVPSVPISDALKQNSTVVAALLIAFSVLLAGIIGFGRKKEE